MFRVISNKVEATVTSLYIAPAFKSGYVRTATETILSAVAQEAKLSIQWAVESIRIFGMTFLMVNILAKTDSEVRAFTDFNLPTEGSLITFEM